VIFFTGGALLGEVVSALRHEPAAHQRLPLAVENAFDKGFVHDILLGLETRAKCSLGLASAMGR
jgi:hypothetical protein